MTKLVDTLIDPPEPDHLLVIALRTNQAEVQRRLDAIFALTRPPGAEVHLVEELTVQVSKDIEKLFGYDALKGLGWTRP